MLAKACLLVKRARPMLIDIVSYRYLQEAKTHLDSMEREPGVPLDNARLAHQAGPSTLHTPKPDIIFV